MRRLLLIMMIALFAVGLTACGPSSEPAPEPAVEEAAPEETAEEEAAEEEAAEEEAVEEEAVEEEAADEEAVEEEAADEEAADDEAADDEAADEEAADEEAADEEAADDEAADEEAADDEAADDEAVEEEAAEEEAAEEEAAAEEAADDASADEAIYTVDAAASTVGWYGAKAVGGSHTGVVDIAEGQMSLAGDQLVEGSFTMDMTTIHTDDSARLLGHLKSDDFFGIETYPTASLTLKSATPTDTEGQYEVVGDLTIKESTQEITFMADVTIGEGTMTATADIVFDRSLFDVRYGSGSFFDDLGDDLINDEVELTVEIVANG